MKTAARAGAAGGVAVALTTLLACAHRPPPPVQVSFGAGDVVEGEPDPDRMPPEDALARAEALARDGATDRALALLAGLTARRDLAEPLRVRALVERGVVELRATPEAALATLREATDRLRGLPTGSVSPGVAAHAWFYLGEALRTRMAARPIDTSLPHDALAATLEGRSQELLDAQEAYLTAGKQGDAEVTVAAGTRVGELYEAFRAELLGAPLPAALPRSQAPRYRAELRRRLRVLAEKAADAYAATLSGARKRGLRGEWVDRIETALARVREELAAEDASPPLSKQAQ